jgi:hypothetical protein
VGQQFHQFMDGASVYITGGSTPCDVLRECLILSTMGMQE